MKAIFFSLFTFWLLTAASSIVGLWSSSGWQTFALLALAALALSNLRGFWQLLVTGDNFSDSNPAGNNR